MKSLLRHPLAWGFLAAAVAMGIVMSLSYLGAFLDPIGNARGLPIAVVDEDAGVRGPRGRIDLGGNVVAALTSPQSPVGDAAEWSLLPTRREALARIERDEAFAAVVIPRDYSQRLAGLVRPLRGLPRGTTVEVLTNPAAGSFARSATEEIATTAVMGISTTLAQGLAVKGGGTRAEIAHRVDDAVQVRAREAITIGDRSARGLAPFYFALMLGLAGFVGMVMISIGVEFMNGHVALDLFAMRLHRPISGRSRVSLWGTKLVLALALAVLVGVLQTVSAVSVLGMTATDPVELALFAVLGVAAAAAVTLAFLTAFGLAGSLLGILFITILGVPASGGPYPIELLPGFFRFLAGWLPLRYMTDGARSLAFFDGKLDAGLGPALWVLAAYTAGGLLVGGLVAYAIDWRLGRRPDLDTRPDADRTIRQG